MQERGGQSQAAIEQFAARQQANIVRKELDAPREVSYDFAYTTLQDKIQQTREKFLEDKHPEKGLAYAVAFDTKVYDTVHQFRWMNRKAYEDVLTILDAETDFNLTTLLGEKFHVGLSKFRYELRDGIIFPPNSSTSMLDIIKRGQEHRENKGSTVVDREKAEVAGFAVAQKRFAAVIARAERAETDEEKKQEEGVTILSVSPPDGPYKHSFYDTWTLRRDASEWYIEARRYSSALSREESLEKLAQFDLGYKLLLERKHVPSASHFLSNPVVFAPGIATFTEPDAIHRLLHKDHAVMNDEDFQQIVAGNEGYRKKYIQRLRTIGVSYEDRFNGFKAIINNADELAEQIKSGVRIVFQDTRTIATDQDVALYAARQMKAQDLPCGIIGGSGQQDAFASYGSLTNLAMAVNGPDGKGALDVSCPACKTVNTRPFNGYLELCKNVACYNRKAIAC